MEKILLHIKDCSSCRGNAQGWPWKRSLARKNVLACFKKSISMLCWKVSKCRSWKGTYVVQNLFLMNNALITFFLLSKRAARIRSFFSPTHPLALFLHFFYTNDSKMSFKISIWGFPVEISKQSTVIIFVLILNVCWIRVISGFDLELLKLRSSKSGSDRRLRATWTKTAAPTWFAAELRYGRWSALNEASFSFKESTIPLMIKIFKNRWRKCKQHKQITRFKNYERLH